MSEKKSVRVRAATRLLPGCGRRCPRIPAGPPLSRQWGRHQAAVGLMQGRYASSMPGACCGGCPFSGRLPSRTRTALVREGEVRSTLVRPPRPHRRRQVSICEQSIAPWTDTAVVCRWVMRHFAAPHQRRFIDGFIVRCSISNWKDNTTSSTVAYARDAAQSSAFEF